MNINVKAWSAVRSLVNESIKTGAAERMVENVGAVRIECRKELVCRSRGDKLRKRFVYFLDGVQVPQKSVWAKTGSCRE